MSLHYGLWDQVRTDQGKEWNLMLFVNERLSHLRNDCSRPPHLQSTSKQVRDTYITINAQSNVYNHAMYVYTIHVEPHCRADVGGS